MKRFVRLQDKKVFDLAQVREQLPSSLIPDHVSGDDLLGFGFRQLIESPKPERPHPYCKVVEADPVGCVQQWQIVHPDESELSQAKQELCEYVNHVRDQKETEGFSHAGLWFQSDERSVARISSTALTASAALIAGATAEFPDWVAADNTPLPVDAQGVLALQASLTRHGGALHAHARALKARVLAAQTAEDLAAIDITAGWPA